jgi:hypothetical protein
MLGGRTEEEFVRTTGHLGPYLTCDRGIRLETDTGGLVRVGDQVVAGQSRTLLSSRSSAYARFRS